MNLFLVFYVYTVYDFFERNGEYMDKNSAISAARKYLETELMPKIKEIVSVDDVVIVIGGSLSYGFFDEESDVDVYVIWDLPRDKWFLKLREFLFMHKIVDGFRIQYIPLSLQSVQYAPLSCLLNNNLESLIDNNDIKLFYDIQHFIPIHDTKNTVIKAKEYISKLDFNYWKNKCIEHSSKHIDTLEIFYSSIKRNNVLTGSMFYGKAIQGLLEIAYLAEGHPYPTGKWLWNGLEKVNNRLFEDLKTMIANQLPATCEDMKNNVFNTTKLISYILKKKDVVPTYVADALLYP